MWSYKTLKTSQYITLHYCADRGRQTDRETRGHGHRETEGQRIDRQAAIQTGRRIERHRETETETERRRDTKTVRETNRHADGMDRGRYRQMDTWIHIIIHWALRPIFCNWMNSEYHRRYKYGVSSYNWMEYSYFKLYTSFQLLKHLHSF